MKNNSKRKVIALMMAMMLLIGVAQPAKAATPATVQVTNLTNSMKGMKVTWKAVSGVDGYDIYRYTVVDGDGNVEDEYLGEVGPKTKSFTDNNVPNGAVVTYGVYAFKGNEIGECDNPYLSIRIKRITLSSAENQDNGILLKWKKNSIVDGYMIYRSVDGGAYEAIDVVDGAKTVTWLDETAPQGSMVNYKVVGIIVLDEDWAIASYPSAVKGTVRMKPVTFTSLKSAKARQMTVRWKKMKNVDGFEICYGRESDLSDGKIVTKAKASAYLQTITKLSRGKEYYAAVRAYKVVDGVTYYSSWTEIHNVIVKS